MWVFLNDAFFSIVDEKAKEGKRKTGRPLAGDVLVVRARRERDVERVFGQHMRIAGRKLTVTKNETTDYRFRARIPRSVVKEVMAAEVDRVVYGNFKDSVEDNGLHCAYLRVWGVMLGLQPRANRLPLFEEAL